VARRRKLPVWAIVLGVLLVGALVPASGKASTPQSKRRLTRAELEALARDVGFPDPVFAATIALRESGGDPSAINDTRGRTDLPAGTTQEHSIGLWQINLLAHPKFNAGELLDARRNAEAAFEISNRGTNWGARSTSGVKHSRGSHGSSETPRPPTDEELDPEPEP